MSRRVLVGEAADIGVGEGRVVEVPRVGGLHQEYLRKAA